MADCQAILHVARKRAARVGRGWLGVLRDYSALDANNERAAEVRTYGWGNVEGKGKRWNARWAKLRALVAAFEDGTVPDPCPRAEHWGGTMDAPRGRMVPAHCSQTTANRFYAVLPERRAVLAASEAGDLR